MIKKINWSLHYYTHVGLSKVPSIFEGFFHSDSNSFRVEQLISLILILITNVY